MVKFVNKILMILAIILIINCDSPRERHRKKAESYPFTYEYYYLKTHGIVIMKYDGKTYIINYHGGIIEHKGGKYD